MAVSALGAYLTSSITYIISNILESVALQQICWLPDYCFLAEFLKHIRAMTRDFQQCGILTSVDSDEPMQPPVKLRNFKCCSVSSLTLIEYSCD